MLRSVIAFALLATGCAATLPGQAATATSSHGILDAASLNDWAVGAEPTRGAANLPSTAAAEPDEPPTSRGLRQPSRRGPRIDARFHRAPLAEALRLLAAEAGVNLVIADGLTGEVTVSFRRVRALDALEAVAHAHGATIEWRGDVALVREHGA